MSPPPSAIEEGALHPWRVDEWHGLLMPAITFFWWGRTNCVAAWSERADPGVEGWTTCTPASSGHPYSCDDSGRCP